MSCFLCGKATTFFTSYTLRDGKVICSNCAKLYSVTKRTAKMTDGSSIERKKNMQEVIDKYDWKNQIAWLDDQKKTQNNAQESIYNSGENAEALTHESEKNIYKESTTKQYGLVEVDECFDDAAKLVVEKEKASIGMLQRVFKISFNRAARIMDQLCDFGIVGEEEGTKPRRVLKVPSEIDRYLSELPTKKNCNTYKASMDDSLQKLKEEMSRVTLHDLTIYGDGFWAKRNATTKLMQGEEEYCKKIVRKYSKKTLGENRFKKTIRALAPYVYEYALDFDAVSEKMVASALNICLEIIWGTFDYLKKNNIMSQDGVVEKELDESRKSIIKQSYRLPYKNIIPKYDELSFYSSISEYRKNGSNAVTSQLDRYFYRNADASDVISALNLNKTLSDEIVLLFKMANEKGKEVVSWEDLSELCKDAMMDTYLIDQYYMSERNIKELLRNIALAEANGVKLINTNNKEQSGASSYNVRDGIGFEDYCISLLQANGYENIQKTPASGDHGVDITADKDFVSYAIQCKYYSSPVGNAAIQEAYSGKMIYKKDIAVVMTNNEFTSQAISDANALGVKLWDFKVLDSFKKARDT